VFPEGTRSRGRGLQKFKKGAFHAAVASGAPITMVCVQEYADEALGWTGRRESVAIRVLPPIETEGLTADDIPELIERCHRKMSETIATL
jgi:1-acyl-sn-glycerol-3-phosphate acyltransferase